MMDSISNTAFERFKVQRSEDRSGEAEKRGGGQKTEDGGQWTEGSGLE